MQVRYYYCKSCGYEEFNIWAGYARTVANGMLFYCPDCGKENFVDVDEEDI